MNKLQKSILFAVFIAALALVFYAPGTQAQTTTENANVIVETVPDSSIAYALLDRVKQSWPWYVTRASGLIAGVLLIILILSGVGFITGGTYRFLEPITAWATHKALGIALVIAVIIHIVALYFDTFVHFDIASLLVPFASDYQPVEFFGKSFGSLYVAMGILALYVFLIVVVTSLIWLSTKPKQWKAIHILTYLGAVLVFIHGLYLGTDLASGLPRLLWILAFLFVTYGIIKRLWRVKTT